MSNGYITIQSWMRDELDLSGNELIIYAVIYGFSQDGESSFHGSRQYLADWCGCSVRNVQTILNNLVERGLLSKYEEFVAGNKVCYYMAVRETGEKISPPVKKFHTPSEKTSLYNIDNTIEDSILSKDNISEKSEYESHMYSKDDFLGSCKKKQTVRRKSLYDQCVDENCLFSQELSLTTLLNKYLVLRLSMKDKPMYGINQWKGLLNKLADIVKDNPGMSYEEIVSQSIERGYASFFPVNKNSYKKSNDVFSEGDGLSCEQSTETEEERKAHLRKRGRRAEF